MPKPTKTERARMDTGFKLVGTDLSTDDRQGGRFRYHLNKWAEAPNGVASTNPCPAFPGDGLCVARSLAGAQSGGARLGSSVMLTVGWLPEDVLADSADKVRVKRLFVDPDPIDPVALLVWAAACGADLGGAYLKGADLGGAYLKGAYLRGAYLRGAYLRGAYLRGAYLGGAYLGGAYLKGADLGGADLGGAYLGGAYLKGADLGGADLGGADLKGAYLGGAYLRGAYLRGANLSGANLSGADLRGAYGNSLTALPSGWIVSSNGYVVTA